MATYDGANVFGTAVTVEEGPIPPSIQENTFFGLNGVQTLHGGGRGVQFSVSACFVGASQEDVVSAQVLLNSYVDGIGRQFVDNYGRTYDNVLVYSRAQPWNRGIKPSAVGWVMPYSVILRCLNV